MTTLEHWEQLVWFSLKIRKQKKHIKNKSQRLSASLLPGFQMLSGSEPIRVEIDCQSGCLATSWAHHLQAKFMFSSQTLWFHIDSQINISLWMRAWGSQTSLGQIDFIRKPHVASHLAGDSHLAGFWHLGQPAADIKLFCFAEDLVRCPTSIWPLCQQHREPPALNISIYSTSAAGAGYEIIQKKLPLVWCISTKHGEFNANLIPISK